MIPIGAVVRVSIEETPLPNQPPPRRPRNWLDALVATALRWNDRLSRPIHSAGNDAGPSSAREAGRRSLGIDRRENPAPTLPPRSR